MSEKRESVLHRRLKTDKCPGEQNIRQRRARYNYTVMRDTTVKTEKDFSSQLTKLRMQKGVSAREMSLSLGQGAGYINNIENGKNLPSMSMFFEICEYFRITPKKFFDYVSSEEYGELALSEILDGLDVQDKNFLIALAIRLKRKECVK